jgi:hypothetical protein
MPAAHADTRFCASAYGYTACDPGLRCLTYQVDASTGAPTVVDAFEVGAGAPWGRTTRLAEEAAG